MPTIMSHKWNIILELVSKFKDQLKRESNNVNSTATITVIQVALVKALNKAFPKKKVAQEKRSVYWWNESIANARKQCTKARKKLTKYNKRCDQSAEARNTLFNEFKEKALKKMRKHGKAELGKLSMNCFSHIQKRNGRQMILKEEIRLFTLE